MYRLRALSTLLLLLAGSASALAQEPEYLLYGGKGQNTFLGCLNCSRFDNTSIWNKLGPHGSEFDNATIWSKTGVYGSPYQTLSPWNRNSFEGPVVRDKDGNSYGKFTRNQFDDQTKVESLLWILENYDYVISNLNEVRLRH
ncbi:hypothetical protein HBA54_23570 [Pelagibius litoralis]|uniref:Cytochrome c domain-containing protein n=1 Tax=Pelagibius litoralis TaxID=374515 RepID=A0A967F282_9PROT|nr:hypothetical protein [Pelagibius litoralis]NIA71575.1 hypothetical protein [Pelagibius litoralis]